MLAWRAISRHTSIRPGTQALPHKGRSMLEDRPRLESGSFASGSPQASQQRRRMLLAVVLLIFALATVLVKDRHIWFGSAEPSNDLEPVEATGPVPGTGHSATIKTAPVGQPKKRATTRNSAKEKEAESNGSTIVATDRRALPPLEVEVVAGDSRQNVRAKNNSIQVDMLSHSSAPPAGAGGVTAENSEPTNAAERVKMSASATQALERPVNPSYPVLARQMKVQGSVVLEAWIAKDGLIQDLKVVSGPAILSSAAREAVRQWRFKPYLQNGQPVETEARITVNFTISTL